MCIIPNLPEKNPEILIINKFACEDMFKRYGARIIKSETAKNLTAPTNTHPDMQIAHLGGNTFVCEPSVYSYYKKILGKDFNVLCGESVLKSNYPGDIAYNIARVGRFVIHNFKYTDPVIKKYISDNNLVCVNVSQGYAKCNVCVVDENSIITEDKGIYDAFAHLGGDCLLIKPGSVSLKGYKYGFIGGASVKLNKNTLAFFGDIKLCPDYAKTEKFLRSKNVAAVSLKGGKPEDLGSVIVI